MIDLRLGSLLFVVFPVPASPPSAVYPVLPSQTSSLPTEARLAPQSPTTGLLVRKP